MAITGEAITPRLPDAERLASELADKVIKGRPSERGLWQVRGAPTTGKTFVLSLIAERLAEAKFLPVLVSPPIRAMDSGPAALVEAGTQLRALGIIDGQLDLLAEQSRPWSDKLALL